MKLVIASDIHGSATWCRAVMDVVERESPDKLLLLGDLLYHGPRNPLPDEYAPKEVAAMLNSVASSIVSVRGNCDAEVDQMMLDFPCMADYAWIVDGATQLYCTHGHLFDPDGALPPLPFPFREPLLPRRSGECAPPRRYPTHRPCGCLPQGLLHLHFLLARCTF